MRRFEIDPIHLAKWMHQNNAEYTGDYVEGVLLDSFVVATKRGFAAIYDTYVNANQSTYTIEWEKYPSQEVWKNWYQFEEKSEYVAG